MAEEVEVSPTLLGKHLRRYWLVAQANDLLSRDVEFNALLEMANINAVKRLRYNDHGPVHARIVAGSALEMLERLVGGGVTPSSMAARVTSSMEEVALVVFLAAMMHDLGNAVHRHNHEMLGAMIARPLLDRVLRRLFPEDRRKRILLRQEVMHAVYATEQEAQALTVEAGIVKVADGTDMAEGRARIPYMLGKNDIHALSALSVQRVTLSSLPDKPVVINVYMRDTAGVFQVEKVLGPKINTSGIRAHVAVRAFLDGRELRLEV